MTEEDIINDDNLIAIGEALGESMKLGGRIFNYHSFFHSLKCWLVWGAPAVIHIEVELRKNLFRVEISCDSHMPDCRHVDIYEKVFSDVEAVKTAIRNGLGRRLRKKALAIAVGTDGI